MIGAALGTSGMLFFLEDPKRYWWLGILAFLGALLIIDDVVYYLSNGKWCMLCSVIAPGRPIEAAAE